MDIQYARIAHAIYLIDDNEHPFAGWEFDNRGLAADARGAYAQFNFDKVHAEYDTFLTRCFRAQTDTTVTLECNFFIDAPDGFAVRLFDQNQQLALALTTKDGAFCVTDGAKVVPTGLLPLSLDTKNSFKAVIDLKKRVYRAIINNRDAGVFALVPHAVGLASMAIGIEKGYTGSLRARGVKMYADYFCNERFLAPFAGEIPCDWSLHTDGGKVGMRSSSGYTFTHEDIYYLDIESGKRTVLTKTLQGAAGELCFECKFLEKSSNTHTAFLLDGFGLVAENGMLSFSDGMAVGDYPRNIWNTLRMELLDGCVRICVNGKERGVWQKPHKDAFHALTVELSDDTSLALDDILLFGLDPLPADYVSVPEPVKEKGYHVGLHVFSSWRYGFWVGTHDATWDVCSPYDEVTPYMGYYDEGIPEVADWENKWFCEHGIDFQLQCWYGPGVIDEPIKFPGFSHALHDGYFNSVYKEYSKFAIMWEDNFTNRITPEAFEKYLVPFFIEYYFKDPCYYKIDGRPVFSIYNLGTLAKPEYFGSVEKAREEMDFLRNAVKEAGMPDIILLCAGGGGSEKSIDYAEALGVEGMYAYNWGTESYTAEFQQGCLTNAAENVARYAKHSLVHVPTVGVGFNCVARHDDRHPSISIPEYEKILTWTKDQYLADTKQFPDQNSWQSKMVLLSCWNEFDEGHYINPSGLHGFGFLDTLRDAFCEAPKHVDAKPTAHQKERIDILYPSGHAWMRPERRLPGVHPTPDAVTIKSLDFADPALCELFDYQVDAHEKKQENGALCGVSDGVDPQIIYTDPGLNADDVTFIRVVMSTSTLSGRKTKPVPQIFFATDKSPNFSADKCLGGTSTKLDEEYSEILFCCGAGRNWNGTITALRLDPMMSGGSWKLKKLEFLQCDLPKSYVMVDGERIEIGLPFTPVEGDVLVPLYAKCPLMNKLNLSYRWNREAHRITLLIGDGEMTFTAGSDTALCGKVPMKLPGKVVLTDGVPALPIRFLCGICGYTCTEKDGVIEIATGR